MNFRFYPSANKCLDEIWIYTATRWGEEQADCYITGLMEFLQEVDERPYIWRHVRGYESEGIYQIKYRHHFIFFRKIAEVEIGVIDILHENMDIPRRLADDWEDLEGE